MLEYIRSYKITYSQYNYSESSMNKIISILLIVLGSVNLASAEQACTARNCSNCERMFVFNHEIQKVASSNLERSTFGVLSEI